MVDDLLSSIKDEILVEDTTSVALQNLYEAYLRIQEAAELEVQLGDNPTGKELKEAVRHLPAELKLRLLNKYVEDQKTAMGLTVGETPVEGPKSPIDRIWEDRPLRRFIVKTLVVGVVGFIFVLLGVVVSIGYFTGKFTDGVLINTLLNTAIEVIKLIFGAD